MVSILGKCPTCGDKVSTSADSCPHCGERDFKKYVSDENNPIVKCDECNGTGERNVADNDALFKKMRLCSYCNGTGAREKLKQIDLRTGERTGSESQKDSCPRPTSWGAPSSSGCAVMLVVLLSAACALSVTLFP